MRIGVPKETKTLEGRVALVPAAAGDLVKRGHEVWLETGAGASSGFGDEQYTRLGVRIAPDAAALYDRGELIVKVKEPIAGDLAHLRRDHLLFCYLHLAAEPALTRRLLEIGLTGVAFETVELPNGDLPLLAPMSIIAGKIATQVGTTLLHMPQGMRHSMGAGWNQQKWQVQTGGSPLYGAAFFGHFISNDGKSILPDHLRQTDFFGGAHPVYIHNYALTLRGGYAYTVVLRKHWFVIGAADVGAGPALNTTEDITGAHRQKLGLQLAATGRLGLGYNAQKWYAGAIGILHGDRFPLAYDGGVGYSSSGVVRLVVARRLFFEGGHKFWAP